MDAMSHTEHHIETAQLRRSPRYGRLMISGAVLGLVVAIILTLAFDGTQQKSENTGLVYSMPQVLGFVALICIPVGIALGGAVALILDRVVGRRTRDVRIDRETVTEPADPADEA